MSERTCNPKEPRPKRRLVANPEGGITPSTICREMPAAPEDAIRPALLQPIVGTAMAPIRRPDTAEPLGVSAESAPVSDQGGGDRRGQPQGTVERVEQALRR